VNPAFQIEKQPSSVATWQLVRDFTAQISPAQASKTCLLADDLNPFSTQCWTAKTKIISLDIKKDEKAFDELLQGQDELLRFVKKDLLDVVFVMISESSRNSKSPVRPYGTYDMPQKSRVAGRHLEEEPMSGSFSSGQVSKEAKAYQSAPTGIIPLCHASEDACNVATNNCSGHGQCYLKYGTTGDEGRACFTCGCVPTVIDSEAGKNTIYWGGPACSKQDISAPFWLLGGFSVVLMGVVGWAISMLFAVGQEKLPGVIGAGVSGPKAR